MRIHERLMSNELFMSAFIGPSDEQLDKNYRPMNTMKHNENDSRMRQDGGSKTRIIMKSKSLIQTLFARNAAYGSQSELLGPHRWGIPAATLPTRTARQTFPGARARAQQGQPSVVSYTFIFTWCIDPLLIFYRHPEIRPWRYWLSRQLVSPKITRVPQDGGWCKGGSRERCGVGGFPSSKIKYN